MHRCAPSSPRCCARSRPLRCRACASSAARGPRPRLTRSCASPCMSDPLWKTRKGGDPMRRIALLCLLAMAACASTRPVEEARKHYTEGRGEEAVALLERTMKERPNDLLVRAEYFRLRDNVMAQWLVQADALRSGGQFEAATVLYERVRKYDPANGRAAAGLGQLETDRAHRAAVGTADILYKAGKYREAQDVLRPVLSENPQQRDARRLQRQLDDKLTLPVMV